MDIMSERSNMLGATLAIESSPEEGTEVVVSYTRGKE